MLKDDIITSSVEYAIVSLENVTLPTDVLVHDIVMKVVPVSSTVMLVIGGGSVIVACTFFFTLYLIHLGVRCWLS